MSGREVRCAECKQTVIVPKRSTRPPSKKSSAGKAHKSPEKQVADAKAGAAEIPPQDVLDEVIDDVLQPAKKAAEPVSQDRLEEVIEAALQPAAEPTDSHARQPKPPARQASKPGASSSNKRKQRKPASSGERKPPPLPKKAQSADGSDSRSKPPAPVDEAVEGKTAENKAEEAPARAKEDNKEQKPPAIPKQKARRRRAKSSRNKPPGKESKEPREKPSLPSGKEPVPAPSEAKTDAGPPEEKPDEVSKKSRRRRRADRRRRRRPRRKPVEAEASRPAENGSEKTTEEKPPRRRARRRKAPSGPRRMPLDTYRADASRLASVRWLAFFLSLALLFSALPLFYGAYWNLGTAPGWARLAFLVALLQAVYVTWMLAAPDWASVRVVFVLFAGVSMLYAVATAVAVATPLDKPMPLDLGTVRHPAKAWCSSVLLVMALATYLAGRATSRWRRAFELEMAARLKGRLR